MNEMSEPLGNPEQLLTHLTEAKAGSRELDCAIAEVMGGTIEWSQDMVGQAFPVVVWGDRKKGEQEPCPRFTTSLDAKLPGEDDLRWEIYGPYKNGKDEPLMWKATCFKGDQWRQAKAHTEPLARRLAALKAKEVG